MKAPERPWCDCNSNGFTRAPAVTVTWWYCCIVLVSKKCRVWVSRRRFDCSFLFICGFCKCVGTCTRNPPGTVWGIEDMVEDERDKNWAWLLMSKYLLDNLYKKSTSRCFKIFNPRQILTSLFSSRIFLNLFVFSQFLSFSYTAHSIVQEILQLGAQNTSKNWLLSSQPALATSTCHLGDCTCFLTGLPAYSSAATWILNAIMEVKR